jgi:hypothetical protein
MNPKHSVNQKWLSAGTGVGDFSVGTKPVVATTKAPPKKNPPPGFKPINPQRQDRAKMWILDPLSDFADHEAFPAMIVSIILFEKYARVHKGHHGGFTVNSKGIAILAATFGLTNQEAFWFWGDWRNGLLHRCMPRLKYCPDYMITGQGAGVRFDNGKLFVNPWEFRSEILKLVNSEPKFWTDPQYALPEEYEKEV